jgi:hypothetical protein
MRLNEVPIRGKGLVTNLPDVKCRLLRDPLKYNKTDKLESAKKWKGKEHINHS